MSLTIVSIFKYKIKVIDQFIYYINQSHLLSYIYIYIFKFYYIKMNNNYFSLAVQVVDQPETIYHVY